MAKLVRGIPSWTDANALRRGSYLGYRRREVSWPAVWVDSIANSPKPIVVPKRRLLRGLPIRRIWGLSIYHCFFYHFRYLDGLPGGPGGCPSYNYSMTSGWISPQVLVC